jgi:catechol-2,3-dioxygenase
MKNLSFDHVHYRTSSFKKTKRFYVDIMEGIELPNEALGGNENLHIQLGGVSLLFILSNEKNPKPLPATKRHGAYHIAFLVDDCKAATDYYCSRGAKLAIDIKPYSDTIVASFLAAPDGMMVELKQIIPAK